MKSLVLTLALFGLPAFAGVTYDPHALYLAIRGTAELLCQDHTECKGLQIMRKQAAGLSCTYTLKGGFGGPVSYACELSAEADHEALYKALLTREVDGCADLVDACPTNILRTRKSVGGLVCNKTVYRDLPSGAVACYLQKAR